MHEIYQNPLCQRYASREMQEIFSDDMKFRTWRRLWLALAESQQELGLPITDAQVAELRAHLDDINYGYAAMKEKELRHDVMAHIHAFGSQCPKARPIIHLGATSAYVGDNADIIRMRAALIRIKRLLFNAIAALADFAEQYKSLPCLAYTHFQPAQPTTVGKRAALWIEDLLLDVEQLDFQLTNLRLLGCKGTTGTQASFLALFEGDHGKVKLMEEKIAAKMGFSGCYPVSGQTYSRKVDYNILSCLSGIAQSAAKFSNDMRLLNHLREIAEPFESQQVGSSAMAYKRNPMRSERIGSLARFVICDAQNPAFTAASQWFERTLDDSANKRITVPEAFLAVDGILSLYINIIEGCSVYPHVIAKHLADELPFMATEDILMHCVAKGGDRQTLHEAIRQHSVAAAEEIKTYGKPNDLLSRIAGDPLFQTTEKELNRLLATANFSGRAASQTQEFLAEVVDPLLERNRALLGLEIKVEV